MNYQKLNISNLLYFSVFITLSITGLIKKIAYLGAEYQGSQNYLPRIALAIFLLLFVFLEAKFHIIDLLKKSKWIWITSLFISGILLICNWANLLSSSTILIYFPPFTIRIVIFFSLILSLKQILISDSFVESTGIVILSIIVVDSIIALMNLSPFSSSFSEGSWINSANQISIFLKTGQRITWPILDPMQIFILAIPLTLGIKGLILIRIYLIILRLGLTFLVSLLLSNRLKRISVRTKYLLIIWGTSLLLFTSIGPHVLIVACILLAGINFSKPIQTTILGILSSILAGLCRLNWFVVPAILLVNLYIFETPQKNQRIFSYLWKPTLLATVSVLLAFLTYFFYTRMAGIPFLYFSEKFHYLYIPSRLFPNSLLLTGTLFGALIIGMPANLFCMWQLIKQKSDWLRMTIICLSLMGTFVVGTIISARIGGGYDFHNFDIYFIFSFILLSYCLTNKIVAVGENKSETNNSIIINTMIPSAIVFSFLMVFILTSRIPFVTNHNSQDQADINELQSFFNDHTGQKTLFLVDQQLPLLGIINVKYPLYDFDNVTLTEYLMAQNDELPNLFLKSLKKGNYPLIISYRLNISKQKQVDEPFADENNIWVSYNYEILKFYRPVFELKDVGLLIYRYSP